MTIVVARIGVCAGASKTTHDRILSLVLKRSSPFDSCLCLDVDRLPQSPHVTAPRSVTRECATRRLVWFCLRVGASVGRKVNGRVRRRHLIARTGIVEIPSDGSLHDGSLQAIPMPGRLCSSLKIHKSSSPGAPW